MKRTKKWLAALGAGLLAVSLTACGGAEKPAETETSQVQASAEESSSSGQVDAEESSPSAQTGAEASAPSEQTDAEEVAESGSDILVVYFSRTGEQYGVGVIDKGNTEIVADMIIEETGADRFEIVPAEDYYPYTYAELTDLAKQEQNEKARPAYAGEAPNLSPYSTIYVGAPVWWGDWPMICYTFFEENADGLAGKTLIPFSTHAGSGLSGFDQKLAQACPDAAVGTGLAISGADAQNDPDKVRSAVREWIAEQ